MRQTTRQATAIHATALAVALLLAAPFGAQAQPKQPPQKGPPPAAPAKPYTPIAVTIPALVVAWAMRNRPIAALR